MKKLVAAVLTGVLVAGTLSTGVYAKDDDKTITVAASATPHAEILEEAKPLLEKEGYDLEVTVFDDYVRPNEVVESGEFDANYFQHIPYLDQFNEEKGTHLVNAGGIHYEPFGIYPGTKDSLDDLEDGDSIAVPNDTTNEARALLLLQDNGIITLKDGAGLNATVKDIAENPHNVEIVELEAAQVARVTGETAYVVLNGNYALEAGFSVGKDALAYEKSDSEAAKTYVNVIAVKEGNENSDKIKALVDVLKSDEIKDFINEKYDGAVIPFDDSADTEEVDAEEADSKDETKDDAAEENAEPSEPEVFPLYILLSDILLCFLQISCTPLGFRTTSCLPVFPEFPSHCAATLPACSVPISAHTGSRQLSLSPKMLRNLHFPSDIHILSSALSFLSEDNPSISVFLSYAPPAL